MFFLLLFLSLSSPLIANNPSRPRLQELLVPKNLSENKTIRLLCALVEGESVVFDWFLDDQKLIENDRRKIKLGDQLSELTIKSLSVDDLGEIRCRARNENGEDNQRVQIMVKVQPKWSGKMPEDVISTLNNQINVDCDVKAYPPATVRWMKMIDNNHKVIKEFASNKLNFELTKETAGVYKCVAQNTIGRIERTINVLYFGE